MCPPSQAVKQSDRSNFWERAIIMKKLLSQLILCTGLTVIFPHSADAQWVKTNGPAGGDVHCLAVSGGTILPDLNNLTDFPSQYNNFEPP
jgi:hypothetical protein